MTTELITHMAAEEMGFEDEVEEEDDENRPEHLLAFEDESHSRAKQLDGD